MTHLKVKKTPRHINEKLPKGNAHYSVRDIYLVPETEDGDTQLQVLCHEDLRDMIDITFEENEKAFVKDVSGVKLMIVKERPE